MTEIISADDLPQSLNSVEAIAMMIAGVNAQASRVAPCLTWDGSDPLKPAAGSDKIAEAKLVLLGALKRWAEAGAGSFQQQTAGPFGVTVDTRQKSSGYRLWPSEIDQLQAICSDGSSGLRTVGLVGPRYTITPG